ncbi:MAG: S-layer homology domain-containing protein [Actinomycetota bacterium]|nr:S-layer homology domain-containing protein [Actinomycetota bacterium]
MTLLRFPSRARCTAAAVAGVLLLATVLPGVAAAQTAPNPELRSLDDACPRDEVPESRFTDIEGSTFEREIECLVWYEITQGVSRRQYVPGRGVARDQMATFIANVIDYASRDEALRDLPRYDGGNEFADVADDNVHVGNINRLVDAGVIEGRDAERFAPKRVVTRAQMASFLNGAQRYLTSTGFSTLDDFFGDDEDSVHEGNINAIASRGVANGTGAGRYNPDGTVTRGQMAAFIMRLLDVHVEGDLVNTPAQRAGADDNQVFAVTPSGDLGRRVSGARRATTARSRSASPAWAPSPSTSPCSPATTCSTTAARSASATPRPPRATRRRPTSARMPTARSSRRSTGGRPAARRAATSTTCSRATAR